jgi:protein gp37
VRQDGRAVEESEGEKVNRTSIEWTDFTSNPLKFRDEAGNVVWGCVHASPGCMHCYAETLAKRYGRGGPFNVQTMAKLTPFLDEKELHKMLTYKPASGKRCFIGDMTDVFGPWVPDELLDRLFAVMALRKDVTWQVLSKRSERMCDYMTSGGSRQGMSGRWGAWIDASFDLERDGIVPSCFRDGSGKWFPCKNIWLGVSVEDQQRADERIPHLLQTPAAVRFISAEPLIASVELMPNWFRRDPISGVDYGHGLDWVIVGGESGAGARACRVNWINELVSQCQHSAVPVFVKQLGTKPRVVAECPFDNVGPELAVLDLKSHKGNDMSEWPEDLRVRQFPA